MRIWLGCAAAAWAAALGAWPAMAEPDGETTILDPKATLWRWCRASGPMVVTTAPADGMLATLDGRSLPPAEARRVSPRFPDDWAATDFDDRRWPRTDGTWLADVPSEGVDTALVLVRGKFLVDDPSRVRSLTLAVKFRGGLVVHLNGREVGRAGMPAGAVEPGTPAEPYVRKAFFGADGKLIPGISDWTLARMPAEERADILDRRAARVRSLGPLKLAPEVLRKGVNVLALEVHRADYPPEARTFLTRKEKSAWVPCGLESISLSAEGTGIQPNASRPVGLQVWNSDRNDRLGGLEYGDPAEPLRPVELVAPRNGVAAGRVVISSTEALGAVRAACSDLRAAAGGSAIPAGEISITYATRSIDPWFCRLSAMPPEEVAVFAGSVSGDDAAQKAQRRSAMQPVWVSVRVPAEAATGDYAGVLTVSIAGTADQAVPVQLHVADWTVPDPRDFRTTAGIYDSPETLALRYGAAMWSPEHLKLVDRSLELLGRVGTNLVNIHLVDRTVFGNDDGWLTWVYTGEGEPTPAGPFEYDFSAIEEYLRLVVKHLKPDYVACHLWHAGGWVSRKSDQENTVTVLDRRTGRKSHLQVPVFGTEEAKAFWKPVLQQMRARLDAVGLGQQMCIGIVSDSVAPREVNAMFNDLLQPARWMRSSHRPDKADTPAEIPGGGTIVYSEGVYGLQPLALEKVLPLSKVLKRPGVYIQRDNVGKSGAFTVLSVRTLPEYSLYSNQQGFGRVGLDYWWGTIAKNEGESTHLFRRWLMSRSHPGAVNPPLLSYPGPDGPDSSVCLESLREGMQEAEAVLDISAALERPDRLPADLARRCRELLSQRHEFVSRGPRQRWATVFYNVNHHGWQDLSRRTYELAGEVAQARARAAE